jgi:hypothetical protein
VTAGLGQHVGRRDPLGGRHVEEGEGAHAGTRGGTAGVGGRRVTYLVEQPGARASPPTSWMSRSAPRAASLNVSQGRESPL